MTVSADEKVGLCWECGYSLKGLPTPRCPECGRPFDPADERTMNMGGEVGGLAGRLMRPPGWSLHLLAAVAVLMSLWAAATPMPSGHVGTVVLRLWRTFTPPYGGSSPLPTLLMIELPEIRYLYAFAAWALVAVMWWARRVVRGVVVWRVTGLPPAKFAYWRRWLVPYFVLLATVLCCLTPAPVLLGFWASKPWIDAARRQAVAGQTPLRVRWVGIYPAIRPEQGTPPFATVADPDIVTISGWGGFLYAPKWTPGEGPARDFRHLGGGWYVYLSGGAYP